jgi:hypothetical protein
LATVVVENGVNIMIWRRTCRVALTCALLGGAIAPAQLPRYPDVWQAYAAQPSAKQSQRGDERAADEAGVVRVMWLDPVDLESRDLFCGIGGKDGEPNPTDRFRFLGNVTSGHAEKIEVEDSRDRRWTVKFGEEPGPETVATRIIWAVGYHVDQDYFVEQTNIEGRGVVRNVRFERDNDGYKKVGRWDWNSNPFVGTRELDGLKVLMAFLNNFDLKTDNNKIVRPSKKKPSGPVSHIYYVNDLGASMGSTGKWFGGIPILGEAPAGTKGSAKDYAKAGFIDRVDKGIVTFQMKRTRAKRAITGIKVENAQWMGNLLARLSDKQLSDAFRAGGFSNEESQIYIRAMRARIARLQRLTEDD